MRRRVLDLKEESPTKMKPSRWLVFTDFSVSASHHFKDMKGWGRGVKWR